MGLSTAPESRPGYTDRRAWLLQYFDRTAADAWARLTSDAPVSGVRATVRAGRDRMRSTLLSWLPTNLSGARVLDAGCGTGQAAIELARRGAEVVAIDLSPTLVALAAERAGESSLRGRIDFRSGDMLDPELGSFEHVLAMDSLIHYESSDIVASLAALAPRVRQSMVWTFAPWSPALAAFRGVGRLFPRGDRAPAIVPVREARIRSELASAPGCETWAVNRTEVVRSGFYTSQAMELLSSPRRQG